MRSAASSHRSVLRGVAVLGAAALIATGTAAPAQADLRGCGADQSDWVNQGVNEGFRGEVDITHGTTVVQGRVPAERFVVVAPFAEVKVETTETDAYSGTAAFDGSSVKLYEHGYRWTVPASESSPGGQATFVEPECQPGSDVVRSAVYLFRAEPSYTGPGAKSVWGTLTRTI
ncbi:hypothetical protein [Actinoplanes rectilineatus]|uniref:hypothetical protein n=1 Tax=Actinoplanes rectilineatus TaxID=113571 RepID=UPI0005F29EA0|nr:hypothetical protein [Actinoplanes rectilineatus]